MISLPPRANITHDLQRWVGIAVVVVSAVAAVFAYYDFVHVHGLSPAEATVQLEVLGTGIWLLLGIASVWWDGVVGQTLQVVMVTVVMLLSALTSVPGELTSLLFFSIAAALVFEYDLLPETRYRWWFFASLTTIVLVVFWFRLHAVTGWTLAGFAYWIAGAGVVITLYAAILRTHHRLVELRHDTLEREVHRRTTELQTSLRESEQLRDRNQVLLRELQHRTRNNLQLISSLLTIQQSGSDTEERSSSEALEIARRRVQAMATAHQLLHRSEQSSIVDLRQYILELTNEFVRSGQLTDVFVEAGFGSGLQVPMDFAVPLGLVTTELVANTAEHTYALKDERPVWIHLRLEDSVLVLELEDRGSAFPADISIEEPASAGLQIVAALVAQTGGEIKLERKPNTKWTVRAPLPDGSIMPPNAQEPETE
jgi:two-component sensor histidine kinase